MSGIQHLKVASGEDGIRLDRWFRRRFPELSHGRLARLLRTGQVRIDGRRAQTGSRVATGQVIRVPPLALAATRPAPLAPAISEDQARILRDAVIYQDNDVIAVNKPSGLAVQGGSKVTQHLDGMLDALRFGGARPRLVHRLDRDTSGVLLLARTPAAAAKLAAAFRRRQAFKTYWAMVAGVPRVGAGRIDQSLAKRGTAGRERMVSDAAGKTAVTEYTVIEAVGRKAAWLELRPLTGRTHQLRSHCAALGTPIVGDAKYGGSAAIVPGLPSKLHLHARALALAHPATDSPLTLTAPLMGHMAQSWELLGFPTDAPVVRVAE